MSTENAQLRQHQGRCFCGEVELRVEGQPLAMGYCHCDSCRAWSAGPVNAFTLWPPASVTITKGKEKVGRYQKTPNSVRTWCTECGGHLLTDHPGLGVTDVYAAVLATDGGVPFIPAVHVNYAESTLPMRDGLPKQMDFPKEMGGSGTLMQE